MSLPSLPLSVYLLIVCPGQMGPFLNQERLHCSKSQIILCGMQGRGLKLNSKDGSLFATDETVQMDERLDLFQGRVLDNWLETKQTCCRWVI